MQPGHAPPTFYSGLPVPGATMLAGVFPRASLAASPTPDEAEARRLTALLRSYNAALTKMLAMPASAERDKAVAQMRAQITTTNAQRAAVYARLNARDTAAAQPSGITGAVENVLDALRTGGKWLALGAGALLLWKVLK